ncbi:MAG: hypothetical protein J4G13_11890 [Dehalococcoidia bacterium]|nr:hypothetical protein [Dehalococcoidia bacterium]
MVYGMVCGAFEGLIKLWSDQTYDYALAYGFSAGLSLVVGMLIGVQTFYLINLLLRRYIRAIRSHVDGTMELVGVDPAEQTSTSKIPFLFHAATWFQMGSTVLGAMVLWVSICHLVIRLLVGFPEWTASLFTAPIGLGMLVSGVSVGLIQCYQLDRQAKDLRRRVVAHLSEEADLEPVSDGTAVVTALQTGEKWVGSLTGFRSGVLRTT